MPRVVYFSCLYSSVVGQTFSRTLFFRINRSHSLKMWDNACNVSKQISRKEKLEQLSIVSVLYATKSRYNYNFTTTGSAIFYMVWGIRSSHRMIVRVRVVLKRTIAGD